MLIFLTPQSLLSSASDGSSLSNASTTRLTKSQRAMQAGVAEVVRAAYERERRCIRWAAARRSIMASRQRSRVTDSIWPGLQRIVDYTPRDMTILVEAGVRMADLAATLAAEGQQLPIDVPRASEATIGGVVATNWNGPRRYGHGTIRDYVIGIHAVDGRGVAFKGGGRVVKNVAGYDFCKLLTGSLGTLGVITQLALKVKPLPEHSATIVAACADLRRCETILGRLAQLEAPPVAIDSVGLGRLASSTGFRCRMRTIRIRRSHRIWSFASKAREPRSRLARGTGASRAVRQAAERVYVDSSIDEADALWKQQVEFADRGAGDVDDDSPLVVQDRRAAERGRRHRSTQLLDFDAGLRDSSARRQRHRRCAVCRSLRHGRSDDTCSSASCGRPRCNSAAAWSSCRSKLEGLTPHLDLGRPDRSDRAAGADQAEVRSAQHPQPGPVCVLNNRLPQRHRGTRSRLTGCNDNLIECSTLLL